MLRVSLAAEVPIMRVDSPEPVVYVQTHANKVQKMVSRKSVHQSTIFNIL